MFDLLISCLPRRFVKLIEFFGFSGDRKVGLEQLTMAIDSGADDHYLPMLAIVSIHYFCFFEFAMGLREFGHWPSTVLELVLISITR